MEMWQGNGILFQFVGAFQVMSSTSVQGASVTVLTQHMVYIISYCYVTVDKFLVKYPKWGWHKQLWFCMKFWEKSKYSTEVDDLHHFKNFTRERAKMGFLKCIFYSFCQFMMWQKPVALGETWIICCPLSLFFPSFPDGGHQVANEALHEVSNSLLPYHTHNHCP